MIKNCVAEGGAFTFNFPGDDGREIHIIKGKLGVKYQLDAQLHM